MAHGSVGGTTEKIPSDTTGNRSRDLPTSSGCLNHYVTPVSLQRLYKIVIMLNRNVISTAELSVILTFSQHTEVGCSVFYPDRKQSELTVATVTYMSFFLSGLQT